MLKQLMNKLTAWQQDSYETYRWDKHITQDTIDNMTVTECREVLTQLWSEFPVACAWCLAVEQPLDGEILDALEGRIQARFTGF